MDDTLNGKYNHTNDFGRNEEHSYRNSPDAFAYTLEPKQIKTHK